MFIKCVDKGSSPSKDQTEIGMLNYKKYILIVC